MFLLFFFAQFFWEVKLSAWFSDEESNEESYQLMADKRQQEICRGNYPSKKSP